MQSSVEIEQTVLGHALNRSECLDLMVNEVNWNDFIVPNHKVLAFCLFKLVEMGVHKPDEEAFLLVVGGYPGKDRDYGGTHYIRQLRAAYIDPTDNYSKYLHKFKLESAKNRIGGPHIESLMRAVNNPGIQLEDIRRIVGAIDEELNKVENDTNELLPLVILENKYMQELEDRKNRKIFTTGIGSIDEHLVEGLAPGKLSIWAGFTGMAKTTLAVNCADRISSQGFGVGFFSMESLDINILDKIIACRTQISIKRLIKEPGSLIEEEKQRIVKAWQDIKKNQLYISDRSSMTIDAMRYQIMAARRLGYQIDVAFIDLFGKIEDVDTGTEVAMRIQKECKRMRVLAKELKIHFAMLVQIGRQGYGMVGRGANRHIKRPILTDIKNANAYAEEADLCFLLHRNKYYLPELTDDILEVDIAKQRMGEVSKVYLEMFADMSTVMSTDKLPHDIGAPLQEGD